MLLNAAKDHFGFYLPSVSWSKRVLKFEAKFHVCFMFHVSSAV